THIVHFCIAETGEAYQIPLFFTILMEVHPFSNTTIFIFIGNLDILRQVSYTGVVRCHLAVGKISYSGREGVGSVEFSAIFGFRQRYGHSIFKISFICYQKGKSLTFSRTKIVVTDSVFGETDYYLLIDIGILHFPDTVHPDAGIKTTEVELGTSSRNGESLSKVIISPDKELSFAEFSRVFPVGFGNLIGSDGHLFE